MCICTYRRPRLLERLLKDLAQQQTDGRFSYSIVVVDNDHEQSAKAVVDAFASETRVETVYCVQPHQNIALARNMAVQNARGEFLAFIDDDEFPTKTWLLTLYRTCIERGVDGVLGPVKPHYEVQPPKWVLKGGFYDRPSHPTGHRIHWTQGRTGNVLLKRNLFAGLDQPFRPEFLTGEDQDFFRRMIEKGHIFLWCHEAMAYEVVPPIRWQHGFLIRRALLRGKVSLRHEKQRTSAVIKSLIALPLYLLSLPFLLLLGRHVFVKYLIKVCDHGGRLLALVGLNWVKESYVTE